MDTLTAKTLARLKELELEHDAATKQRDRWSAKVKEILGKMEAYKVVLADSGGETSPTSPTAPTSTTSPTSPTATAARIGTDSRLGGLAGAVLAALPQLTGSTFNPEDVKRCLGPEFEETKTVAITSALIRLEKAGKIEVVERGSGRRQSTYRLLKSIGP